MNTTKGKEQSPRRARRKENKRFTLRVLGVLRGLILQKCDIKK